MSSEPDGIFSLINNVEVTVLRLLVDTSTGAVNGTSWAIHRTFLHVPAPGLLPCAQLLVIAVQALTRKEGIATPCRNYPISGRFMTQ